MIRQKYLLENEENVDSLTQKVRKSNHVVEISDSDGEELQNILRELLFKTSEMEHIYILEILKTF